VYYANQHCSGRQAGGRGDDFGSGAKTKKELISNALREFVTARKRLNLLDLDGKIKFSEAYDYKRLREGR